MSLSPEEQRAWADVENGVARDMEITDASFAYAMRKSAREERVERAQYIRRMVTEITWIGMILMGAALVMAALVFVAVRL